MLVISLLMILHRLSTWPPVTTGFQWLSQRLSSSFLMDDCEDKSQPEHAGKCKHSFYGSFTFLSLNIYSIHIGQHIFQTCLFLSSLGWNHCLQTAISYNVDCTLSGYRREGQHHLFEECPSKHSSKWPERAWHSHTHWASMEVLLPLGSLILEVLGAERQASALGDLSGDLSFLHRCKSRDADILEEATRHILARVPFFRR